MKVFDNQFFISVHSGLAAMIQGLANLDAVKQDQPATQSMRHSCRVILEAVRRDSEKLNLAMTLAAIKRFDEELKDVEQEITNRHIIVGMNEISSRLMDEIERASTFFIVPTDRSKFFDRAEGFGKAVSKKFPRLTEDIAESGNCFAAGRYTACVFHLMRIVEHGVQRFGKKLGVKFTDQKVWQVILDEVNKHIKTLDHKKESTKRLAEIAAHLYNVKVAWRNEVMHPKKTYTEEEAEKLLERVADFMQSLARVV